MNEFLAVLTLTPVVLFVGWVLIAGCGRNRTSEHNSPDWFSIPIDQSRAARRARARR